LTPKKRLKSYKRYYLSYFLKQPHVLDQQPKFSVINMNTISMNAADRISQLPEHIIHYILSLLLTPEVVCLSLYIYIYKGYYDCWNPIKRVETVIGKIIMTKKKMQLISRPSQPQSRGVHTRLTSLLSPRSHGVHNHANPSL
jgi:hypothetical protein